MGEQWRSVVGYEGFYEVSDYGNVRSVDRRVAHVKGGVSLIRGQRIKPFPTESGHLAVDLYRSGRSTRRVHGVHPLVLTAFVGPRPKGMEACHNNGIPGDNRVTNLRWDTRSENMLDIVRHGKHVNANKTQCKSGHSFTSENTYMRLEGGRACRECRRIRNRQWRERKQGANA